MDGLRSLGRCKPARSGLPGHRTDGLALGGHLSCEFPDFFGRYQSLRLFTSIRKTCGRVKPHRAEGILTLNLKL